MNNNINNRKTDVLVVGGGGREHAIIKKLSDSPRAGRLYAAPGNAGIAALAHCLPVKATDTEGIVAAAKANAVDLVFVAPDDPLMLGTVDRLIQEGIRAFGPKRNAALIEGSKVFSKGLMKKYGIPTASYEVFASSGEALAYIRERDNYPAVIKADGLALGKGAVIAGDFSGAAEAVRSIMDDRVFGESGRHIVVEEFMTGPEVTVLAFTDGKTVIPMVSSQDHKRAQDGDKGLNTGGMGAFSPSLHYTPEIAERCMREIYIPTIKAMAAEGRPFSGVIYFQMMLTQTGPRVVEYNARFGDPEAQVVLPRLKTDLIDIIDAVIDGRLSEIDIEWKEGAAACVVIASGGYPLKYGKGYEISGLESVGNMDNVYVYHAGTSFGDNSAVITAGGRVLGVTAEAATLDAAVELAYKAVSGISFRDMHYRRDIGRTI
ncbi:MAG: phosphoribosylamine--glycine ligase [Eubacteriales bacterium]|jgi:phosphoribosylamine--glycine ligase|nr:phosphoribosylamine--glycine ligase [Eubacteriales bacterium]